MSAVQLCQKIYKTREVTMTSQHAMFAVFANQYVQDNYTCGNPNLAALAIVAWGEGADSLEPPS